MTTASPFEFFLQLADPFTAEALFDRLIDVVFFIKNNRAEYLVVNRTLVDRCGVRDKKALLGRTAKEVAQPPLGESSWKQDLAVLETGTPILNNLELHSYATGKDGWCLTDKFPLFGRGGNVIGLAGISHDLHAPSEAAENYLPVAEAVRHAREHLDLRLGIKDLAAIAKMSPYQLDQRIRRLFRLSAGQMMLKFRMDAAAEFLRETDRPVAQIGLACGYRDQSAFARQFRETTGRTPGDFRNVGGEKG